MCSAAWLNVYFTSRTEWQLICDLMSFHNISERESLLQRGDTQESNESSEMFCQSCLVHGCFLCVIWSSLFVSLFLIERIMQQPIPMPLHFRA